MVFLTVASILNVKSPVQKKVIEILYPLFGYSKRLTLLEDLLEKELHESYSRQTIKSNLIKMQNLGLAYLKDSSGGKRFYLDKRIWRYPPELYELLKGLALKLHKNSRSDIKFDGLLKKYKTSATANNRELKKIPHQFWRVTLINFLKNEKGWNFTDSNRIEIDENIETKKIKKSRDEIKSVDNFIKNEVERLDSDKCIISYDDLFPVNLREVVEPALKDSFQTVQCKPDIMSIKIPLSLGRSQQVFVTVRKAESFSKIFWIYTVCGDLKSTSTSVLDFIRFNNDANPIKIAVKSVGDTDYLICAVPLSFEENWKNKLKELIIKIARYGDRIESTFWHEDFY